MPIRNPDFNDPITLQVMWDRLVFIADQADSALGRTAFSPIVRENHDYVTVLLDAKGRALSQCTWSIPVFITSLPMAAQNYFLKAFPPETLERGDILATNDPMIGTGHLPDLVMLTPIFRNGTIVAYAGSIAHLPDIGGRPQSPDSTDMFEEGIRLPILKLFKAGKPNEDVFAVLEASVRLPHEVRGDIQSMVAANDVINRELTRFMDEYGLDDLEGLGAAIYGRSERFMRRAIAALPNGKYGAEVMLDGFEKDVQLKVSVEIRDESIHIDYDGTSPEVARGINVMPHYRVAHSVYALKCLLDPDTPNNEGCMLPITDEAPAGCILNPGRTAAGSARNLIGHVIPSLIFRALQDVLPERVQGDSGGAPIWGVNCQGQREDGSAYGSIQNFHGGQGGRATVDGNDTLSFPSNCKVTPVEMYEIAVPVLTERKELIPDSGGAGKYRGGLGQRGVLRNLSTRPMNIYLSTERVNHPCFGVVGGKSGRAGAVLLEGRAAFPKGKMVLEPGQQLVLEMPGGGGWGNPDDRPHELIERDLREGLVTAAGAKSDYGYANPVTGSAGTSGKGQ
ncbi:hydantoinase B/oxoprolinase family protein [Burkholderia gladioli pv. gladioli]|uniref:hydantoinase B/oxoprolinase family protein n=1 Tax=Burkholderia gladioli TaxID=28095 RepID=UPI0024BC0C07|nr:hydantoinase B/oxoprolinase family protein [Burkholderia gladioli]MDJ1164163.1 hydantoinase B/oxoprolinase family protein [Burkholderia gladioli pv. gladioli]